MYQTMLLLHGYTRWLVLIAMVVATVSPWWGWLGKREWSVWDDRFGVAFAVLFSIQFIWGTILYFIPNGLVQVAWQDISAAMEVHELRFFSVEHGFQMVIALGLVHMGRARSRKGQITTTKYLWAVGTYTVATILILTVIPWWRPLFRTVTVYPGRSSTAVTESERHQGDLARGELLFTQSIGGQPACSTCHTLDDTRLVGPGMAGIATRAHERVPDQFTEDYLYESILVPSTHVVEGYPNVMPTMYKQILDNQQLADLIAYLLSLP